AVKLPASARTNWTPGAWSNCQVALASPSSLVAGPSGVTTPPTAVQVTGTFFTGRWRASTTRTTRRWPAIWLTRVAWLSPLTMASEAGTRLAESPGVVDGGVTTIRESSTPVTPPQPAMMARPALTMASLVSVRPNIRPLRLGHVRQAAPTARAARRPGPSRGPTRNLPISRVPSTAGRAARRSTALHSPAGGSLYTTLAVPDLGTAVITG